MRKKVAPKWTSMVAPEPGPVEGVDNLPVPMGVNMGLKEKNEMESEATPGAMGVPMTSDGYTAECNGDNPKIPDVSGFAMGKDMRSFGASPSSAPKPGA